MTYRIVKIVIEEIPGECEQCGNHSESLKPFGINAEYICLTCCEKDKVTSALMEQQFIEGALAMEDRNYHGYTLQ